MSLVGRLRSLFSPTPRPEPRPAVEFPVDTILSDLVALDPRLWAEKTAQASGPSVLVATSTGGNANAARVESLIAAALALRGAEIHVMLCDGVMPACMECEITRYPDVAAFVADGPQANRCDGCFKAGMNTFSAENIHVHRYSEMLTDDERGWARQTAQAVPAAEISGWELDGLHVGEHAYAGALRFFARGNLEGEPFGEGVLRRSFEASILAALATRRLVAQAKVTTSYFHHGIYVPQGIVGEVLRANDIHVVNWQVAYRKGCFIFSHDDTYHHTLMNEPVEAWENMPWDSDREDMIVDYLRSRWYGTHDWIWFHENPEPNVRAIEEETGVDFSKPTIGLLTNVVWDAQLHYPANAFPGMLDWLIDTIRYFATRPDLQLLIRVHPAEIRGTLPTRQPAVEEIRAAFPELPSNVFVIGPESDISTYAAMDRCDSVIIYGTKTGVELTSMGTPVIVAGEAWIRNKGITIDAKTAGGYFQILDELPLGARLDPTTLQRARKYAYHFFMRRMIPLEPMRPTGGWPLFEVELDSLLSLMPGSHPGLDVICSGITEGTPFVFDGPAEIADSN